MLLMLLFALENGFPLLFECIQSFHTIAAGEERLITVPFEIKPLDTMSVKSSKLSLNRPNSISRSVAREMANFAALSASGADLQ
jgi:hypothetical protein